MKIENIILINALEYALKCCIELIDHYEEPIKKQCGKSSETRNMAQRTLDISRMYRESQE